MQRECRTIDRRSTYRNKISHAKICCLGLIVVLCGATISSSAKEEWKRETSRHFIVYYQNTPEDFVDTVLDAAEDLYDEIVADLGFRSYKGWAFDNRAQIYIYDNQDHYVSSAHQSGWSAGAAYYEERVIKTYPSARGFFDSLLPHELGHIIFHEFIGDRVVIPRWFDEGVAMYQERAKQWGAHQTVKQAISDGTFIPLEELDRVRLSRSTPKEKIELFYAESASVVNFLIHEHGRFKFMHFCRRLRGGDKFPHALESSYPRFKTLERLNRAWKSYLEKQ